VAERSPDDSHLSDLLQPALPGVELDLDQCRLSLCTSGSSGEPKRIDKTLRQLANEVEALEQLWGADLGEAWIIGSVATQHIYGLLFRVLWPLCAGRPFVRRQLAFPEDLQRASREHPAFAWVGSPALLKRMGDNLDWPALSAVRRVFSSGGALPADAAQSLQQRLQQWPTEILGSSETGGIAWRQGASLWQPFADVELSQDSDGALLIASPYLPAGMSNTPPTLRASLPTGVSSCWAAGPYRQTRREAHFPADAGTGTGRPRLGRRSTAGRGSGKPRSTRRLAGAQRRRPVCLA
jgi:acyl-CoA synthetase (AMP-forming)/AMP-acid ligase II